MPGRFALAFELGRRAARDGSLTARATGRHSHILFSLLAVLSNARLSPSHATSQPQLFYHYIHIYLRSHQINTPTFHPRHLSASFYVFWKINVLYLLTLVMVPPSPGTLTKHNPPELQLPRNLVSARGLFYPDRPVLSLQSSSLGLQCQPVGILSKEPYCLR
jgi:hypothetical protein